MKITNGRKLLLPQSENSNVGITHNDSTINGFEESEGCVERRVIDLTIPYVYKCETMSKDGQIVKS